MPCRLVGSDQATTGDTAGDSILSSSASSSWEHSLFLQEHRHGREGPSGRQGPQGGEPTLSLADHPERILGGRWGQGMVLPKGPPLPAGKQKRRRGDTSNLWISVSASIQWPSIKVTALTWDRANPNLHPSPASSQCVTLASYSNPLSCLSFPPL